VQRVIGSIEIEDDFPGGLAVCVEKQLHPQPLDRGPLRADLVIAALALRLVQLQAVQRALARQRRTLGSALRLKLAQQCAEHRVMAQVLVVIEVLVPQRHPEHALPDQRPHRMLNQVRIARIDKTPCQPIDQTDRFIGLPEQQRSGIRADRAAVKSRHHAAPFYT